MDGEAAAEADEAGADEPEDAALAAEEALDEAGLLVASAELDEELDELEVAAAEEPVEAAPLKPLWEGLVQRAIEQARP